MCVNELLSHVHIHLIERNLYAVLIKCLLELPHGIPLGIEKLLYRRIELHISPSTCPVPPTGCNRHTKWAAFALVRFRSEPGNPKNIAYIFATVAAGLACGVQCYLYATIFTIFLCFILLVFSKINFGSRKIVTRKLRVLIPETLDYEGVFEETLSKYTTSSELERIGTLDLGSTFELVYDIVMKDNTQTKELIDELRCLNGNLTVSVYLNPRKSEK